MPFPRQEHVLACFRCGVGRTRQGHTKATRNAGKHTSATFWWVSGTFWCILVVLWETVGDSGRLWETLEPAFRWQPLASVHRGSRKPTSANESRGAQNLPESSRVSQRRTRVFQIAPERPPRGAAEGRHPGAFPQDMRRVCKFAINCDF